MPPTPLTDWLGFDPHLVTLALAPAFLLAMAAEFWQLQRGGGPASARYTWADTFSNMTLAGLYQASDVLAALGTILVYNAFFDVRLFDIPFNAWTLALLFVIQDFFYYWFHRAHHRIRLFWCSHVVHHSSERLNLSTAFRQSVTYPLTGMWLFWLPIVIIGFPPETVVFAVAISLAYQFFIHTQLVAKLGPLEWVFNTPSHHRAHHGRNGEYIDRNYGGILIIWDRLFGTFVEETRAPDYGIPERIDSHNPLVLSFHEWKSLIADLKRPDLRWGQKLQMLLAPPERARELRERGRDMERVKGIEPSS
ncbi:MAG: sterol desaturase family protein [Marinobacter sp.]|uniref:sterol desaturase family protein n=1 Tax=Marinobacter sp. TaxID=50741 RepID=UPI00299D09B5|nr:sterol desaturase family protein [Marinobacter sp.]MDX1634309.1 sterol desaturase family protein [Marinobacter sp.]